MSNSFGAKYLCLLPLPAVATEAAVLVPMEAVRRRCSRQKEANSVPQPWPLLGSRQLEPLLCRPHLAPGVAAAAAAAQVCGTFEPVLTRAKAASFGKSRAAALASGLSPRTAAFRNADNDG